MDGDHLTTTLLGGNTLDLSFFGNQPGDKWRLYFATGPCNPAIAVGPLLPTIPDPDGDGSFLRISAIFPYGFDGMTFRFAAVWGNGACGTSPGVGFTNCVTVVTAVGPPFGQLDDGTVESGWTVQNPTGSSDFFNNNFGPLPGSPISTVVDLRIAVLDFVTATPAFPATGVSNPNLGVDPTGNTPDIAGPGLIATIAPFTFPSGTFATTAAQYVEHSALVGTQPNGIGVHGWIQFPPGDPALLECGVDTTVPLGHSFLSADGYTTPAEQFLIPIGNSCIQVIIH
jgi:hypothetical protein